MLAQKVRFACYEEVKNTMSNMEVGYPKDYRDALDFGLTLWQMYDEYTAILEREEAKLRGDFSDFPTIDASEADRVIELALLGMLGGGRGVNRYIWNRLQSEQDAKKAKTAKGFVYFLLADAASLVKVGWQKAVNSRTHPIHSHCPYDLRLIKRIKARGGLRHEREVHRLLMGEGLHYNREWFIYNQRCKEIIEAMN